MPDLKNSPALRFSVLLTAGIITGSNVLFNPLYLLLPIVILAAVGVFQIYRNSKFSSAVPSLLIILAGILKSNFDFFYIQNESVYYYPETGKNSFVTMTGVINEIPDYDSSKIKFVLNANSIVSGKDTSTVSGKVSVTIRKNIYSKAGIPPPILNAGDLIRIKGKIQLPPGKRNPGEFDYRDYLFNNYIYKIFNANGYENVKAVSTGNLSFTEQSIILPGKLYALKNIDEFIKGDCASYLKGLVTGERSDISEEVKTAFIDAGVMHLIAVSGLNVAYIIISVTLLLSVFRIPLMPRTIVTAVILVFYCLFTGSPASIVRATLTGIALIVSVMIQRKVNFYNTIGFAASVILLFDSKQLFNQGFILSFVSVLSMVLIYTLFEKIFVNKIHEWKIHGRKFTHGLSVLFFTSLAAQIGTLPVTVNYFGKVSVISLLANVVIVPLANLSLAVGFFQILTGIFSNYMSSVIAVTNNLLLNFQLYFIKWCASLDFAYIKTASMNPFFVICYYFAVILMITVKDTRDFFKKLIIASLTFMALMLFRYDFSKKLRVTFLDIGQGDCTLIQTPENKTILVDCGMISQNYNSGERTIGPYLIRNGISKIDLLIITHLHNDHTGGVNYLLQNFNIGCIIESGQKTFTSFSKTTDSLVSAKNIYRKVIRTGDVIKDLNDIRLYFLLPDENFVNNEGVTAGDNLNNGSVVFLLKYKESKLLFTGDTESEGEKFLYKTYNDFLKSDVLKVAHHGSITSTGIPFVMKCRPDISVISCGKFNKFNHPSGIILNRLERTGSKVFRTDTGNAVILETDGYEFEYVNWK